MNIFFLHRNARKCAKMHINKHTIKMCLETTQMLCTAHHVLDTGYTPPYKQGYKNHPCTIWARTSQDNYTWLCELGLELCKEYTYRYNKVHACEKHLLALSQHVPDMLPLNGHITPPALAMPDMYKCKGNAIASYRTYYFFDKNYIHAYKKRDPPLWLKKMYMSMDIMDIYNERFCDA